MSGSSLDGLDLAICTFSIDPALTDPVTEWSIKQATTVRYSAEWQTRLRAATELSAGDAYRIHGDLGDLIGREAAAFLRQHPSPAPTLVGCHGHTTFHEPALGYSIQLGEGSRIAAHLKLPVVTELRTADIAAGGQGAPLAPIADRHLFPSHAAFLNLGGIANFSLRRSDNTFIAGDVTGCCQVLDRLAAREGLPFDRDGALGRGGAYLSGLAKQLDALPFHAAAYPKSLSNQWVTGTLWPVVDAFAASTADLLHTYTCWLANKIRRDIAHVYGKRDGGLRILVSGGGARNAFLVEQLRKPSSPVTLDVEVAEGLTGDFKEAALIALCAVFRQLGMPNSLASATGASHDTVNGALYAG